MHSHLVFRDRWISVRADACGTQSDVEIELYYVFEFTDFVHTLAFDTPNRALLIRQYRHAYAGMTLERPGGIMDKHETDVVKAATRELREENGFSGRRAIHLITLSSDPGRHANRVHLILVKEAVPGAAAPVSTEDSETVSVPRDELASLAS